MRGITVFELRARARRLKRQHGIRYVMVDYLGLMTGPGDNRVQMIGNCTKGLKAMAKELDLPVVVLAQLNRQLEGRSEKRPVLSDLRDSGDIEQDADVVLFLHREKRCRLRRPSSSSPSSATAPWAPCRCDLSGNIRASRKGIGNELRSKS